ncbi:MAG: hypothetical protein ACREKL_01345, partial [Chthoniobacterales bacterium]
MYRGKKQKFDWAFGVGCGDVAAVALSFPVSFAITRAISPAAGNGIPTSFLTCVIYAVIILIAARRANLH